ncbi:ferritin-like protein (plasmid) [Microvirga sp. RSM25]|uniref:ferritin-like domain-containing protein n=1 Tax=Microvirga sp. RSM25 TaxID=3273802 RepID=UPI00384E4401
MTAPKLEAKKLELLSWLQLALELEWSTLPPYLVALLSIKRPQNREAADLIRGVAMEEMLHFALVANVMNALGGRPKIARDNCPTYPLTMTFEGRPFADRTFPISLARFSKESISTFMKIEQPQQAKFETLAWKNKIDVPAPTIGEFYEGILTLLDELDAALPDSLFTGDPRRQLEADYFWGGGGEIIIVSDLTSARTALETVIEQGEGAWPFSQEEFAEVAGHSLSMGHYYRFSEIFYERRFIPTDDPRVPPSGPAMAIDYTAVYPIRENAKSTDYPSGSVATALNEAFNRRYTMMMRQLDEAVNGEPKALYTAIMYGMHGLASAAKDLMATPMPGVGKVETACPTFEWMD